MASVFQRGGKWYGRFKDESGKWAARSCGGADKATSLRRAVQWEGAAGDVRSGRVDPRAERYRTQGARAIGEHIADFKGMLAAKGDGPDHVADATSHVFRIVKLIGAARLSDLTADGVRQAVASIRDSGRALGTCNAILRSVKTFVGWLVTDRRVRYNDLDVVRGFNAATDRRRVRRDLEDDELARLIDAAERGPAAFGMSGEDRAMLYRTAAGTGFRAGELRSLTPKSFDLAADEPSISVTASYSKRRRDDAQPIDRGLADTLRPWLAAQAVGEPVFALPDKTGAMLRGDLRLARA